MHIDLRRSIAKLAEKITRRLEHALAIERAKENLKRAGVPEEYWRWPDARI